MDNHDEWKYSKTNMGWLFSVCFGYFFFFSLLPDFRLAFSNDKNEKVQVPQCCVVQQYSHE